MTLFRLSCGSFSHSTCTAIKFFILLDLLWLETDAEKVEPKAAPVTLYPMHLFASGSFAALCGAVIFAIASVVVLVFASLFLLLLFLLLFQLAPLAVLPTLVAVHLLPLLLLLMFLLLSGHNELCLEGVDLWVNFVAPVWSSLEEAPDM